MRPIFMFLAPIALALMPTSANAQAVAAPPPDSRPAPVPVAPTQIPATGNYGGVCYGNQTCNQGLSCDPATNQCVAPPPAPVAPPPVASPVAPPPAYPQGGYPPAANRQPPTNLGYPSPPPAPLQPTIPLGYENNEGVMVGFGLGLSSLDCEDCGDAEGGLGFDFNLGGFVNPRLAIMFDSSGWYDSEDDVSVSLSLQAAAVQYWLSPKFWIKGAAGVAYSRASFNGESFTDTGSGLGGGLGYEIVQNGNFALDLSGRINRVSINDSSGTFFNAVIGVRWK